MDTFKKKIDVNLNPPLGKLWDSLEMGERDRARLREAVLARASITPQDKAEAAVVFHLRVLMFTRVAMAIILAFTGLTGVVFASNSALPGTPLYQVKMAKEGVELKLASTPQQKALVQARHAENRLAELQELRDKQATGSLQSTVIPQATRQATNQVNGAISSLHEVENNFKSQGNAQQAAAVQTKIETLREHAQEHGLETSAENLNEIENVPAVQPATSTPAAAATSSPSHIGSQGSRDGAGKNKQPLPGYQLQPVGIQNHQDENQHQPQIATGTPPQLSSPVTPHSDNSSSSLSSTTTPAHTESGGDHQSSRQSGSSGGGSDSQPPSYNYSNGFDR